MNYRHAYHAGNHADVLKHVVLVRILEHLKAKDAPFGVLDAHAGIGLYDLSGIEAGKTFEWHEGIGRLAEPLSGQAGELLLPYLRAVEGAQAGTRGGTAWPLRYYPGSPDIAAQLTRKQDRLYFNELHPEDHALLAARYGDDRRVKVFQMDAGTAVKSILPFATGRGLVLIDPPFERTDETELVEKILANGLQRMAHAIFAVWYPIKDMDISRRLAKIAAARVKANVLRAEITVREPAADAGLAGSGLIVINPPWKLADELTVLVPALARRLGGEKGGRGTLDWLAPPS